MKQLTDVYVGQLLQLAAAYLVHYVIRPAVATYVAGEYCGSRFIPAYYRFAAWKQAKFAQLCNHITNNL